MKLFIDLDSVLTDFPKAVQELGEGPARGLGSEATDIEKQRMYDAIEKAGEAFWANMAWFEGGKALWDMVKDLDPVILSSPGLFSYAPAGKKTWVQDNIPGTPLYLEDSKSEYVDPYETSILIDDSTTNIGAWKDMGGIGILHTSFPETERQFLELLWKDPSLDAKRKVLKDSF